MRFRILNFGIPATNDRIITLDNPFSPTSISDFDAFVFDPDSTIAFLQAGHQKGRNNSIVLNADQRHDALVTKQLQIRDLLLIKGGVVFCLLRPHSDPRVVFQLRSGQTLNFGNYFFLENVCQAIDNVAPGLGTEYVLEQTAPAAGRKYFSTLSGSLHFHAHFSSDQAKMRAVARDSVGHMIAAQFPVGQGHILFLPVPHSLSSNRIGAAIVDMVGLLFRGEQTVEAPPWVEAIAVPGANVHDAEILGKSKRKLSANSLTLKLRNMNCCNSSTCCSGLERVCWSRP
jgi:hypothetical protein